MRTKLSMALAVLLVMAAGAVNAQTRQDRQDGLKNGWRAGPVLINRCIHGVWDAYGMRCDAAE